jgi:hypothetical protein
MSDKLAYQESGEEERQRLVSGVGGTLSRAVCRQFVLLCRAIGLIGGATVAVSNSRPLPSEGTRSGLSGQFAGFTKHNVLS